MLIASRRKHGPFRFTLAILLLYLVRLIPSPVGATPIIRSVSIQGNTRTRTEIISRELLFAPGERLDPAKLAETERNLRLLLFLGQVRIHTRETDEGVDVFVVVQDLYSRALSPRISGKPGEMNLGLVALDYNFIGRGQTARLTLDHQAIEGNSLLFDYQVPRLFDGSRGLATRLGFGEEGHDLSLSLSRPYRTLSAPCTYGLSVYSREFLQRFYTAQELTDRYVDRLDGGHLWYARSYGEAIKWRPGVRLSITDRRFAADAPFIYAPEDRRRVLPSFTLSVWRPRYERARFINALGSVEDLQIGGWISTRLGLSHRRFGSDRSFAFYSLQLSPRYKPTPSVYTFATLYLSARSTRERLYHLITSAELLTYIRLRAHDCLALRIRGDAIHRPEDAAQFLLGLNYGLRGYAPRRFDGTRRLLYNLEYRPTFYQHPFYVLAGALFLEGGTAWTPSRDSPALNLAFGLGGRIGLPQVYDTPVLRTDLAYALRDRQFQLSFGIGQYF